MVTRPSAFISYARADDEPFVERLHADLRENDIDVWWDREKMESRGLTFLRKRLPGPLVGGGIHSAGGGMNKRFGMRSRRWIESSPLSEGGPGRKPLPDLVVASRCLRIALFSHVITLSSADVAVAGPGLHLFHFRPVFKCVGERGFSE